MKYFFQAEIKIHIEISDEYFEFIKKCCENHYDHKVKASITPGNFLYGFTNRREWSREKDKENVDRVLDLKWNEVDLICKALEMGTHFDFISHRITKELMEAVEIWRTVFKETNEALSLVKYNYEQSEI